jgi:copper(I)-binding protein
MEYRMKKILAGALVLASLGLTGCSTAANEAAPSQTSVATQATGLSVTNGWVRVSEYSDHVGGMTGVFATITNNTDADVTLIGGACDIADAVQVHEVVMVDGAMKMQEKAGGIVIPAGESVTLEPGGLHVMLMGLKQAVLDGVQVTVTLNFDGAEAQTLTLPAKTSASGDEPYKPKN